MLADADVNPAHAGGKQPKADKPAGAKQLLRGQVQGNQEDQKNRYRPQRPDMERREGKGLQGAGDHQDHRAQPGMGSKFQVERMAQAVFMTHFGLPAANG